MWRKHSQQRRKFGIDTLWGAGFCLGGDKVEGGDSRLGSRVVMRGGGDQVFKGLSFVTLNGRNRGLCNLEMRDNGFVRLWGGVEVRIQGLDRLVG